MKLARISAFPTAAEATTYAHELKAAGLIVEITGPIDMVVIDRPGSAIAGWAESGKSWYVVIGSKAPFQPV